MATYKIGQIIKSSRKTLEPVLTWCFWNLCSLRCISPDTYEIVTYDQLLDSFDLTTLYQLEAQLISQMQLCIYTDRKLYDKFTEYLKIIQLKAKSKSTVEVIEG